MLERIEKIEAEATAAIEAATGTAELEELRVRYLGRKAELTTILRGIADLPAGGTRGRSAAAPTGRARRWRSCSSDAPPSSTRPSWSSASRATGSTSPCRERRRARRATCT